MKFATQLATIVGASTIPLLVLATAGVLCTNPETQALGIGILLALGTVGGLALGVRTMEKLDI